MEAGWGRAAGMFPQSTPLTLQHKYRGLHGGRALPHPPSGSRMAADQVSVWGSASCRQGFGLPWGGDGRLKALLFLSKNTSRMLCLTSSTASRRILAPPTRRRQTRPWSDARPRLARRTDMPDMRFQSDGSRLIHQRNILLLSSFRPAFASQPAL